jgi:transposase
MMVEKRQTSTAEFTHEAVRLVTVHGYDVAEAARNLGINAPRLGRWKREQEAREDRAFPGQGRVSPEQAELHRLREEHKRRRLEREMLKKAAAFFAHEWSCGRP